MKTLTESSTNTSTDEQNQYAKGNKTVTMETLITNEKMEEIFQ